MDDTQLIERAVKGWDLAIVGLQEKKLKLTNDYEVALARLDREIEDAVREKESIARHKYRRVSGETNGGKRGRSTDYQSKILECLKGNGGSMSQTDIHKACVIPISTVGRILCRHPDLFSKDSTDRWSLVEQDVPFERQEGGGEEIDATTLF